MIKERILIVDSSLPAVPNPSHPANRLEVMLSSNYQVEVQKDFSNNGYDLIIAIFDRDNTALYEKLMDIHTPVLYVGESKERPQSLPVKEGKEYVDRATLNWRVNHLIPETIEKYSTK